VSADSVDSTQKVGALQVDGYAACSLVAERHGGLAWHVVLAEE
jgi:hypothetical protein